MTFFKKPLYKNKYTTMNKTILLAVALVLTIVGYWVHANYERDKTQELKEALQIALQPTPFEELQIELAHNRTQRAEMEKQKESIYLEARGKMDSIEDRKELISERADDIKVEMQNLMGLDW